MKSWAKLFFAICLILSLTLVVVACNDKGETSSETSLTPIDLDDPSIVYDNNADNFKFGANSDASGYIVLGYKGSSEYIEIPKEFDGSRGLLPVVAIKNEAFYYTKDETFPNYNPNAVNFKAIKIPDSVKEIGDFAFGFLSNLTNVVVPNSVKTIGFGAFNGCSNLQKLTIPFVGHTFGGDENTHFGYIFASQTYNNNADYIPKSLSDLTITNEKVITEGALAFLYDLKNISLNEGITEIAKRGLWYMSSLETLVIPNSVTKIGDSCLNGQSALKELTIPFLGSTLGNFNVSHIGYCFGANEYKDNAGYMPEGLEKVTLTNQERVTSGAFQGLKNLKTIVLSSNTKDISDTAFVGCKSLVLNEKNGVCYMGGNENDYFLCMDANSDIVTATVEDGCIGIQANAFSLCQKLTSVSIPDSVKKIGQNAFYRCESLTSVSVPDSVEQIGNNAFYSATKLQNINFNPSSNLSIIGDYAFYNCQSLQEFTITYSLNQIGKNAFLGCKNLTKTNILDLAEYFDIAFANIYSTPFENVTELYVNGVLTTDIVIPSAVTRIRQNAFSNLSCVNSIYVTNSVSRVDTWAFYGLNNTQKINFANSKSSYVLVGDWDYNNDAIITYSFVE